MFTSHSLDQILQKGAEYLQTQGAVYLADKPTGITSHDMIYRVRRSLKNSGLPKLKVGHAGTLDPLATGLLIILIGKPATRRQDEFMKQDKHYTTSMWLGIDSDTYDVDGELRLEEAGLGFTVIPERQSAATTLSGIPSGSSTAPGSMKGIPHQVRDDSNAVALHTHLNSLLPTFTGKQTQTVPAYSAVKRGGKKLYELAREGKANQIILPQRQVEIYSLQIPQILQVPVDPSDFKWAKQPPAPFTTTQIDLEIHCSSGTYIRSLVHDLGLALHSHAVVRHLRRTQIGEYTLPQITA